MTQHCTGQRRVLPNGWQRHGRAIGQGRAFTLLEVLVVIAIVSLLVALLLPTLREARQTALQAMCASNQRQLLVGHHTYLNDFKEWLPGMRGRSLSTVYAIGSPTNGPMREYWKQIWSVKVRYCPTVDNSCYEGTGTGPWTARPRHIYDDTWVDWGYLQPISDSDYVGRTMFERAVRIFNPIGSWEFHRPLQHGLARYAEPSWGGYTSWYTKTFDTVGVLPFVSDPVLKISSASGYYMVAHNGYGEAKLASFVEPRGTNSGWYDGHVEWHGWPTGGPGSFGVPTGVRPFLAVATGHAPTNADPGYCYTLPDFSIPVYSWAKKSRKVVTTPTLP